MNQDIKQQWVEALRSGDYEQGYHQLRDFEGRYDAVGVLCDLAVKAGVIDEPVFYGEGREDPIFWGYKYADMVSWAPPAVAQWVGEPHRLNRICIKNDSHMTFNQIADYIEEQFS